MMTHTEKLTYSSHTCLLPGGSRQPPAKEWEAGASSNRCNHLVSHSLIHVAVQLLCGIIFRKQIAKSNNVMAMGFTQHAAVA